MDNEVLDTMLYLLDTGARKATVVATNKHTKRKTFKAIIASLIMKRENNAGQSFLQDLPADSMTRLTKTAHSRFSLQTFRFAHIEISLVPRIFSKSGLLFLRSFVSSFHGHFRSTPLRRRTENPEKK